MRPILRPAALLLAALGASPLLAQTAPAAPPEAAQEAPTAAPSEKAGSAERSTGQIEKVLEPAPPPAPTPIELPADKPAVVKEGSVSATTTAHYSVRPPAGRMIEIRIRSADESAAFSIYRGAAETAEAGTTREEGAVGWISSTEDGGELRIVVWTTKAASTSYQLLVRVHPPEAAQPATPAPTPKG